MDIIKFISDSNKTLEYIQQNSGQVVEYRPEFLLIDISKLFNTLGIRKYKVTLKTKDKQIKEEDSTLKILNYLKTAGFEEDMEVEIEAKGVKHSIMMTRENPINFQQAIATIGNLFKKLKLWKKFSKIFVDGSAEIMTKFMEVIKLMEKTAKNVTEEKRKGFKSDVKIREEMKKIRDKITNDVFVTVNVAILVYHKLMEEQRTNLIPDKFVQEGSTTQSIQNLTNYVFWLVSKLLKDAEKQNTNQLFLTTLTTELGFTYSLAMFSNIIKNINIET